MSWRNNLTVNGMSTVESYPEHIAGILESGDSLSEDSASQLIVQMAVRLDAAETLINQLQKEVGLRFTGSELTLLEEAFGARH